MASKATANEKLRLLVIGTFPPPLGGCTLSLQHLAAALRARDDVELTVVDTRGIADADGRLVTARGAARLARAIASVARLAHQADVVTLHVSTTAVPLWGLVVEGLARAAERPFVLRKFGDTDYLRLGGVRGRLSHFVARHADAYLAETRRHLDESLARGVKARWFPTTRPLAADSPASAGEPRTCRRFVYLGHVTRPKGVLQLVEAMRGFGDEASLDLYGPLFPDLTADALSGVAGVRWHGQVAAADVMETLRGHDAMVMPTLASTEGYPGSIVEAYIAGLPVIASRIGGIPELVDETSGILVEPGDVAGLRAAMQRLADDEALYARLREGAKAKARSFSTEAWADAFVESCRQLAARRAAALT